MDCNIEQKVKNLYAELINIIVTNENVSREELFLINEFKKYYSKTRIKGPENIQSREFGIGKFKKKFI